MAYTKEKKIQTINKKEKVNSQGKKNCFPSSKKIIPVLKVISTFPLLNPFFLYPNHSLYLSSLSLFFFI